jgi:hypothetical protein
MIVQPDGNINIKAFKVKELKAMKNKFVKTVAKTGSVNTNSLPTVDNPPIDNTIENFNGIIIRDILNNEKAANTTVIENNGEPTVQTVQVQGTYD